MHAYAYYGIALCGDQAEAGRYSVISCLVHFDIDYLRDRAEHDALWCTGIEDMFSATEGRWELDNAEPISPRALASLGGVTERQIRKMMWEAGTPLTGMRERIPAESALAWLLQRTEVFYPSIWQDHHAFDDLIVYFPE